jgi:hypothetical protein
VLVVAAAAAAGITAVSSSIMAAIHHEANMQKLWAEAYDAWIHVPGSADRVLYFQPVVTASASSSTTTSAAAASSRQMLLLLPVPEVAQQSVLFGITGWDPLGVVEIDPMVNTAANAKLERVLQSMMMMTTTTTQHTATCSSTAPSTTTLPSSPPPPPCSTYWHAYGLSPPSNDDDGDGDGGGTEPRKEAGFIVAFSKNNCMLIEQAQAAMVALAKEFHQGAIYRFDYLRSNGMFHRKTISAAMSNDVEADVVIARCQRPDFTADMDL